jgi:hypothetical protein
VGDIANTSVVMKDGLLFDPDALFVAAGMQPRTSSLTNDKGDQK